MAHSLSCLCQLVPSRALGEVDHVYHSLLLKVDGLLSEETWGAFFGSSFESVGETALVYTRTVASNEDVALMSDATKLPTHSVGEAVGKPRIHSNQTRIGRLMGQTTRMVPASSKTVIGVGRGTAQAIEEVDEGKVGTEMPNDLDLSSLHFPREAPGTL